MASTERPCKKCGSTKHMPTHVQRVYGDPDYDGALYEMTLHGVTIYADADHKLWAVEIPVGGEEFYIWDRIEEEVS